MKNTFIYCFKLLTIALLAGVAIFSLDLHAAELEQQLFSSPEGAVKALQAAVEAKNKTALRGIFGPEIKELLTGDQVQDANNARRFASMMSQGYSLVKEGDDKITVEVGYNNWPMPIPLVKVNGQWYFDTTAGKEEIINRHIGKDELHAIGVCRAYVTMQQQYASTNLGKNGGVQYIQTFNPLVAQTDAAGNVINNETQSYHSRLLTQQGEADDDAEGYVWKVRSSFHGYYFRVLTRQGLAAAGGKLNYMSQGGLTKGFALVAYPVLWDHSGIMTFIVNQDGKVYQRNFGEHTSKIAQAMKEYNPDNEWTLVQDEGIFSGESEK